MDNPIIETLHPDLCVIGAGAGGLSVAAGASQMGASVVLFEAGAMGGDCLNHGCVPSKALLAAAHQAEAMRRRADTFGLRVPAPDIDFPAVGRHVDQVIAAIAPNDSVERFEGLGVRVIQARARFTDPRTVCGGGVCVRPRRVVIATGSRPLIPPIPGLEALPFLTNETIFGLGQSLGTAPPHLLILGGGPIGCELAQAHHRLGSRVTVIEQAPQLLPRDDPEAAALLHNILEAEGLRLLTGTRVVEAMPGPEGGVRLHLRLGTESAETDTIDGTHLLVAAGRAPNIDGLDLEAAGITASPRGITVDRRLRTSNHHVYALGDCIGRYPFTHMAGYHASVVIKNTLFRLPAKVQEGAVPWVTYTDPEVAQVGLGEAEARARHGAKLRVLRWPFSENDRAQAERQTRGFVKVLTTASGRLLGAMIIGPQAGELIQPWILALANKLKIDAMATVITPYPTLGEVSKRAAGSFYAPKLFSERTRKMVRWLSRLG